MAATKVSDVKSVPETSARGPSEGMRAAATAVKLGLKFLEALYPQLGQGGQPKPIEQAEVRELVGAVATLGRVVAAKVSFQALPEVLPERSGPVKSILTSLVQGAQEFAQSPGAAEITRALLEGASQVLHALLAQRAARAGDGMAAAPASSNQLEGRSARTEHVPSKGDLYGATEVKGRFASMDELRQFASTKVISRELFDVKIDAVVFSDPEVSQHVEPLLREYGYQHFALYPVTVAGKKAYLAEVTQMPEPKLFVVTAQGLSASARRPWTAFDWNVSLPQVPEAIRSLQAGFDENPWNGLLEAFSELVPEQISRKVGTEYPKDARIYTAGDFFAVSFVQDGKAHVHVYPKDGEQPVATGTRQLATYSFDDAVR